MGLWKVPVSGGEESQVLQSVRWRAFTLVSEGIYFIPEPSADGKCSIQLLSFASTKVKTIASLPRLTYQGLTLSPDHRYMLYSQIDEDNADLMLVENFR